MVSISDFNTEVLKPEENHKHVDTNANHTPNQFKQPESNEKDDNPIPLPPRDRNKTYLTPKARHTRKHPLIIPASATLQRTLDKVIINQLML